MSDLCFVPLVFRLTVNGGMAALSHPIILLTAFIALWEDQHRTIFDDYQQTSHQSKLQYVSFGTAEKVTTYEYQSRTNPTFLPSFRADHLCYHSFSSCYHIRQTIGPENYQVGLEVKALGSRALRDGYSPRYSLRQRQRHFSTSAATHFENLGRHSCLRGCVPAHHRSPSRRY